MLCLVWVSFAICGFACLLVHFVTFCVCVCFLLSVTLFHFVTYTAHFGSTHLHESINTHFYSDYIFLKHFIVFFLSVFFFFCFCFTHHLLGNFILFFFLLQLFTFVFLCLCHCYCYFLSVIIYNLQCSICNRFLSAKKKMASFMAQNFT